MGVSSVQVNEANNASPLQAAVVMNALPQRSSPLKSRRQSMNRLAKLKKVRRLSQKLQETRRNHTLGTVSKPLMFADSTGDPSQSTTPSRESVNEKSESKQKPPPPPSA